MSTFTVIALLCVIGVLLSAMFLAYKYTHPRKLSKERQKFFYNQLWKIQGYADAKMIIVDIDKWYHKVLQEIWNSGDFGTILKSQPREIGNIQKIRDLHKLRNTLVHDFREFDKKILATKAYEYVQEAQKLLQTVS